MKDNSASGSLRDRFGACQWFHFEDRAMLRRTVEALRDLGVRHLRTGVSWADYLRPGGQEWYDQQMEALAEFEVLLSVWHTPPSLAESPACNAPPRRLRDYADFIDLLISRYGPRFAALELWNEPNNRYKWDFQRFDPYWQKFAAMVGDAAHWARQRGVTTVLGGMIPVDPHWLGLMHYWGVMPHLDAVAIHAFPNMWWPELPNWDWYRDWQGWPQKIATARAACDKPIWVTETGLATWDLFRHRPAKHELQSEMLSAALRAPAERVYWYSLIDLDPAREAIEGFHVDENEYHMGLIDFAGRPKPAYDLLKRALAHDSPMTTA